LKARFGAETAVGFLYYEILGRAPDGEDLTNYVQRLERAPATAGAIAEELLTPTTSAAGSDRRAEGPCERRNGRSQSAAPLRESGYWRCRCSPRGKSRSYRPVLPHRKNRPRTRSVRRASPPRPAACES